MTGQRRNDDDFSATEHQTAASSGLPEYGTESDPRPVDPKEPAAAAPAPKRMTVRRQMVRILVLIPIAYLAVCLLVYVFQERLVYFPSRDVWAKPDEMGMAYEALMLTASDGVRIAAWYVPHQAAIGTVIFSHGNAGNMADRVVEARLLHRMGLNVLMFDYRGFGDSAGRPGEAGTFRDADAAWNYAVETLHERPERLVLYGCSLGGAVAIEQASRRTPAALVVESTFTNLADVGRRHYPLLPVRLLCRIRYDSISRVGAVRCPKLFIHGSQDSLIPIENGRALFEAASEPKTFVESSGGHNDAGLTASDAVAQRIEAFIREALPMADAP